MMKLHNVEALVLGFCSCLLLFLYVSQLHHHVQLHFMYNPYTTPHYCYLFQLAVFVVTGFVFMHARKLVSSTIGMLRRKLW